MRPTAVLCGSYRRDPEGLRRLLRELEATGCRVLSPLSLRFTSRQPSFVRTEHEADFSIDELERFHLRAIREADFILLHAPGGHVGLSGAFEIGYASALGKPVFSKNLPSDEMLQTRVRTAISVFDILETLFN